MKEPKEIQVLQELVSNFTDQIELLLTAGKTNPPAIISTFMSLFLSTVSALPRGEARTNILKKTIFILQNFEEIAVAIHKEKPIDKTHAVNFVHQKNESIH